jgi:2,4-dienoyl-CoA reductase-like NADH-dependent reductase (Old Yellow Enzyme family)
VPDLAPLWQPATLGRTALANSVALAPMTRISAEEDGRANARMADYYAAYADGGFGLLITEGVYPDTEHSQGYLFQPGLATPAQTDAWAPVVAGVHAAGAKIFAQLMHAGAQAQGNRFTAATIGPSAVPPRGEQLAFYRGSGPYPTPAEITPAQLDRVRDGFVTAALNARAAGFDGVEIHGANGYLLDQFLTDYLNRRTDAYGGSPANRVRLAAEVCRAVRDAAGPEFTVGIRISQAKVSDTRHKWTGGCAEAEVVFGALGRSGIDFVHTTEHRAHAPAFGEGDSLAALAKRHAGVPVIANGNLDDPATAAALLAAGSADVVALGKAALANKDWPRRVRAGHPLAELPGDLLSPLADIKDTELVRRTG